ncbi:MAG: hypothetical protein Q4E53_12110 [Eubacteriales bacterium]|nr:hypothetical protein [Eubacteriales bacterium]
MPNESGDWIMKGLEWDDPYRIRTWEELINYINQVGFLPLFANEVPGFSAEEHVSPNFWWSGDAEQDPWLWREIIARSGKVAYGKFFNKKAGFISKEWFSTFANYRRNGYDFDALYEDGYASLRSKKIMDLFIKSDADDDLEFIEEPIYSNEMKQKAGFGKGGEKNFDGVLTDLQMKTYLVIRDFRKRKRKKDGAEYGWPIALYTAPEVLWNYDTVAGSYREDPDASFEKLINRVKEEYPWAPEEQIRKVLK